MTSGRDGPKPAAPKPQRRKMSFKDKHALETLPGEIETMEAEIAELEAALADPGLYGRDPERFQALTRRHAGLLADKDAAEERWLELEALREEIEAENAAG